MVFFLFDKDINASLNFFTSVKQSLSLISFNFNASEKVGITLLGDTQKIACSSYLFFYHIILALPAQKVRL